LDENEVLQEQLISALGFFLTSKASLIISSTKISVALENSQFLAPYCKLYPLSPKKTNMILLIKFVIEFELVGEALASF